ncbi:cytochrome P450 714B2-like [Durio zibethinus]|uniref:Cytochrome P450 714B2-like n=1 Tax=Durio zibethinus TaxID=66656 RepID=A0A6P6AIK1_DURZI|nr:cytochrome P450 714B2-like [Durio zibethinus]
MELVFMLVKITSTILLVGLIGMLIHLYDSLVLKPERLRSKLQKQGIRGPPPSFLIGNMLEMGKTGSKESNLAQEGKQTITHSCSAIVLPFLDKWRKQYGPTFMFSMGNLQVLHMSHPDVVKEMTVYSSFDLGRPSYQKKGLDPLYGEGILHANGAVWAHQRKVLAPEFYMDKVKGMMKLMVESAVALINEWNNKIDSEGGVADIKIDEYLRNFSGEVISRACFGSNYKEIFSKLRELQEIACKKVIWQGIPGLRSLPTKSNREMWRLEKEVHTLILNEVKEKSVSEKNILQMIVKGAKSSNLSHDAIDNFIVDNCKNICFPAYENGAVTASWTMMLLALYPEWQDKVRAEVLEIFGDQLPSFDMLHKMKTLTMVIYESLRLYPLGCMLTREAVQDMKVGGIHVPKGVSIWVMLMTLYKDPNIWGSDVDKFNPERFVNGINGACQLPHLYIPFGTGPRSCLAQHFAMAELKILLALIHSNFTFSLSPKYRHSPIMNLIIEPEFGVDLLVRRV